MRTLLVALGLFWVGGCWPDRISGKACDAQRPCVDGTACVDGVCGGQAGATQGDGGASDGGASDGG